MIEQVKHITTLDIPELEPYRTLRRPLEHLRKGIFIAEGNKVVRRLLDSTIRIYSLLLTKKWFDKYNSVIEKHQDTIEIFIGEKKLLDTIVGYDLHQAVMAIAKVPHRISVDELIAEENLAKVALVRHASPFSGNLSKVYILLDGVVNAENMGVIIRNCACFGIDAVFVLPNSCDPYLRRSVRNSMGNIFQLKIVTIQNIKSEIQALKNAGIKFYAAHPNEVSKDIRIVQFNDKSCIVLGAEGPGISKEILDLCDDCVTIPMKEGVDSLNVASASAVMMWEMRKAIK